MIKIVSKNLIKESEVEHFLELVREMAAKSIAEKGCIIDAHNNTEHFKRIVPQFRDLREDYMLDKYVEVKL